ncbi:MAG: hypothetical protein JWQ04_369 [Pedosphaera sp.]|nr:hypothetical protein [Pedosphaera sp.]
MCIHFLRSLPAIALDQLCSCLCPKVIVKGIRVVDINSRTRAAFASAIESALELIEKTDISLFKRTKKEILRIDHLPCGGAHYSRHLRQCVIDLDKLIGNTNDEKSAHSRLAVTIVHEATHGYLYSRGIYYAKSNHWRVERICIKEQNRFARMVGFEEYPFESYQHPPFSRRFEEFKRDVARVWKGGK